MIPLNTPYRRAVFEAVIGSYPENKDFLNDIGIDTNKKAIDTIYKLRHHPERQPLTSNQWNLLEGKFKQLDPEIQKSYLTDYGLSQLKTV